MAMTAEGHDALFNSLMYHIARPMESTVKILNKLCELAKFSAFQHKLRSNLRSNGALHFS